MNDRGLDGNHRSSTRGGAARSIKCTAAGAALTFTTLLGLVALGSAGCGDDDTIIPPQGGSGGMGGGAGGGGSSGGGAGGTAGTGGGGSGGTAGTGGSSGTGGSGGTGGSAGEPPDGGVDPDGGDGGPQALTRQEMAEGICAHYDAIPDCTNPEDCVDIQINGSMAFYDSAVPECPELVDAYHTCLANADQSSFVCADDAPGTTEETCQAEYDTLNAAINTPPCCPDSNCL